MVVRDGSRAVRDLAKHSGTLAPVSAAMSQSLPRGPANLLFERAVNVAMLDEDQLLSEDHCLPNPNFTHVLESILSQDALD